MRHPDTASRLRAARIIADLAATHLPRGLAGTHICEVGTGHQLNLPIGLWLCGAAKVTTVDLHRYLRQDLIRRDLAWLATNPGALGEIFGPHADHPEFRRRAAALQGLVAAPISTILSQLSIEYLAPADARRMPYPAGAFDLHVSYTVLEHIPPPALSAIITEAARTLTPDGRFIHCIDFTDHFAHSDPSISTVNFLRFDEEEWARWGGNRFMYHNRLRLDEFERLVRRSDLAIERMEATEDPLARQLLTDGSLPLADRFRDKPAAINAARNAWLVAGRQEAAS